ncbi:MerR family transcriptional regulator [Kordiimonas gwangyangensis]|uniref:MerR family transcriptional regulator n=1 Tax=Kordiimonas gwangyangensis TaxID=288022 RepID=UPI00036FA39B|nr:MerR family DNA-binding transcriptional regulator [Kordiimonas gwangyangensis]
MRAVKSDTYSIKELACEFGVTPRTLRHYEDQGLLTPERQGQNRIYHANDRVRLAWILRGKRVGFSLQEIGEMLDLYDIGDGRETQRSVTVEKCRSRIRALEEQRDDINATIDELQEFCELIANLVRDNKNDQWIRRDTGEPLRHYPPRN